MKNLARALAVLAGLLVCFQSAKADAPAAKIPVLFDTDIGSDIDDAFALGLLLNSPEVELRGVTTVSGDTHNRALMVCRFLTHIGRKDIPVAAGLGKQPAQDIVGWQRQFSGHAAVVWNRTTKPLKEGAVELMYQKLKAEPGKITILAVGPLTNVARLLTDHPDAKPWIKRIVIMGGCDPFKRGGQAGHCRMEHQARSAGGPDRFRLRHPVGRGSAGCDL